MPAGGPSQHRQGRRLRGGGEIALSTFQAPTLPSPPLFPLLMATLETNQRRAERTNKAGDQGRVRGDLWVSLCFPFNWALQRVVRERRPSRHYEPVSLSLEDRPGLLGTFHILHILTRSRIFIGRAEL